MTVAHAAPPRLELDAAPRASLRRNALSLVLGLIVLGATPGQAQTVVASINRDGTATGDRRSHSASFSANGRFVAFMSDATNLDAGGLPGTTTNVYVRDLVTGTTRLASVNRLGTAGGNNQSLFPTISDDGRYVAFESRASDLVPNDTNGLIDVFVRDLLSGTTTLVSIDISGTGPGNGISNEPAISGSGRVVVFQSRASDLVPNDTNGSAGDVFVRNLDTSVTSLVSETTTGGSGNRASLSQNPAQISTDGRYVAFETQASNLVPNDSNGPGGFLLTDVFRRDVLTGTTVLVSVNLSGDTSFAHSDIPHMSADGRFVVFASSANDLVPDDTNNRRDVFVRDVDAGTTSLVSVNHAGTGGADDSSVPRDITPDGRFVAFTSLATDLVDITDANGDQDVFVRDLQTGTTMLASINATGTATGNGKSFNNSLDLSDDGRYVVFDYRATDLVSLPDVNGRVDVVVRDLVESTTRLISVSLAGTGTGDGDSYQPSIMADGRFVGFTSTATDLATLPDANGPGTDAFLRAVNQPPSLSTDGPYAVDEGGQVTVFADGVDPEGQPLTFSWDLDDDGTFETAGQSASFSAADLDGPSSWTITAEAVDDEGARATSEATVNVLNVAPTASFVASSLSLITGQCATLGLASPFDPGVDDTAAGFLYSFDCTDDGILEADSVATSSRACAYPSAGTFTARGRIADKDQGASDYTLAIDVVSPRDGIQQEIIGPVQDLIDAGILTRGPANGVIATATAAIRQLDRGHTGVAATLLRATRVQVGVLVAAGQIPPGVGQELIDALNGLIAALEGSGGGGPAC